MIRVRYLIILFVAWIIWANTAPELNYITVRHADLPVEFSGFRIAQVSDFHNADMIEDLIVLLQKARPDMIAITGDLVDIYHPNIERALAFLEKATEIAPCFYVMGNHETLVENNAEYWEKVSALGVTVLRNEKITLSRNGAEITVMGMDLLY